MNIQENVLIYLDDIAKENLLKRQIEAHVHIPKGTLSVSDSYFPLSAKTGTFFVIW